MAVELKEMEILSLKEDGGLWTKTYDQMPLQTVQAILISFTIVQTLILIAIMTYMFKFAMNGIYWS